MSDADTTAPRASSAYDQHVARRPPDHVLGRRAENGTRHVAGAGASDNDDVRVGIARRLHLGIGRFPVGRDYLRFDPALTQCSRTSIEDSVALFG